MFVLLFTMFKKRQEVNSLPNIKSSIKRVLVNEKKNRINTATKSTLRTIVKKAKVAVANNDASAEEAVKVAFKTIDKAVSKNALHKNTAARKKSKLAKALNAAKAAQ